MQVVTHIRQETRTGCGPACVAMLTGRSWSEVLAALPATRQAKHRLRTRNHSTTVAEVLRLFRAFGYQLERQERIVPADGYGLLKVQSPTRRNWHWCALAHRFVYDPADNTQRSQDVTAFLLHTVFVRGFRVTFYPVERISK